jgi:hypothetical protein
MEDMKAPPVVERNGGNLVSNEGQGTFAFEDELDHVGYHPEDRIVALYGPKIHIRGRGPDGGYVPLVCAEHERCSTASPAPHA